jgi:WD40 repeat protein
MFKVYIEENASHSSQPMEVSPDAPIAQVVPALVEELHLPQSDLFGNRQVYFLRHAVDGRALPDHFSLRAAGIQPEDRLSLESYMAEGAAAPAPQRETRAASFYTGQTIVDAGAFAGLDGSVASPLATQQAFASGAGPVDTSMREKRWPRRALLLTGGAALGAAGLGLANAASHVLSNIRIASPSAMLSMRATAPVGATAATGTALPTRTASLLVFTQHQQTVRALSWSPDGTLLASGASDKQLLIWDRTGQVRVRKGQAATVRAVVWSPNSRQLAVAAGNGVLFLNAQNGTTEARSMHTHRATVTTLAWSVRQPQLLVSAGLDKLAVVWNTQTFQPQAFFRQHTAGILSAGWAADGQTVGSSSLGGVIRVWNGPDGQQLHNFLFDGAVSMSALAFAPAGSRLAVGGDDGVLRLWAGGLTCQQMGNGDMQGQCLDKPQRFNGHARAIRALGWSPDGRLLASAGDDGLLLIWYLAQSQTPLLKIQQNAPILGLSWSPDGKSIATAMGNTVTLWALS